MRRCLAHSLRQNESHIAAQGPSCGAAPSPDGHLNLGQERTGSGPGCDMVSQPQAGLSLGSRTAGSCSFNPSNQMHDRYSETGKAGGRSQCLTLKGADHFCSGWPRAINSE